MSPASGGLGQLSHGLAFQSYLVRAMHDAVQDGVSQGLVLLGRQLFLRRGPVIEQLEQVTALVRGNGGDGEVVQNQQVQIGQLGQATRKAAVTVGHMQLFTSVERGRRARKSPACQLAGPGHKRTK